MIHLLPIGDVPGLIFEGLALSLQKVFGAPTVIHEPVSLPASSFDSTRHQYLSTPILKSLARFKSTLTQVERVLGVVGVDLYAADLNFVFGEADPKEGVAIISITRLRQEFYGLPSNDVLFQERILKEAVQELGHTYGLGHCPDPACVMYFSNSIDDTDRKSWRFCKKCHAVKDGVKREV